MSFSMTNLTINMYASRMQRFQISSLQNRKQRGVALIMVLGMVAIIAAWASTATYEDLVSIRRISNLQDETRATMASESAYTLTRWYLKEDAKLTTTDSLEEDWAVGMPPFPIDEGLISVVIEDSNRFYNLNDLVDNNGVVIPTHFAQLQNLFTLLSIDPDLVNKLVDWLDKDNIPYLAAGAEDTMYFERDYKVKNNRLDNWSELKLILGFDNDTITKLKAVATVAPSSANESANKGSSKVNINTASEEVMMSLFPNMTNADAELFFKSRPYEDTNIVNQQTWKTKGDVQRLSVESDTFMVRTHASFGRANVREEFLLSRTGTTSPSIKLIWRERLGWQF